MKRIPPGTTIESHASLPSSGVAVAQPATSAEQLSLDMFDLAPVACVVLDRKGSIRAANIAFTTLVHSTRGRVLGEAFLNFVSKSSVQAFTDHLRRCKSESLIISTNLQLTLHDGATMPIELVTSPAARGDGQAVFFSVIIDCSMRDSIRQEALSRAENLFRVAILNAPIPMIMHAEDGEIIAVSEGFVQASGYRREQLENMSDWLAKAHEDKADAMKLVYQEFFHGAPPREQEFTIRTRGGTHRTWLMNISPLGRLADGRRFVVAMANDVTDRRRIEEENARLVTKLQTEHLRLATQYAVTRVLAECGTLEEAAPEVLRLLCQRLGWQAAGFWRVNPQTERLEPVAMWQEPEIDAKGFIDQSLSLTFAQGEALPGRAWVEMKPVWITDLTKPIFPRAKAAKKCGLHAAFAVPILRGAEVRGADVRGVIELFNKHILEPQHDLLDLLQAISRQVAQFIERTDAQAAVLRSKAVLEDRVRRRTEALHRANADLSNEIITRLLLEKEILEVSERERRSLGQDLHDGLCQELTAIAFMARALATRLTKKSIEEADELSKLAERINTSVTHARDIARGLHPVHMDAEGLMIALHELAVRTDEQVHCEMQCESAIAVNDSNVALNLYRIAQEAVTNALKHSNAKHIVIGLDNRHGKIALTVRDDGVGVPEKQKSDGMGTHIMAYRARTIGAEISIDRLTPSGTCVTCSLPEKLTTVAEL